MSPATQLPIRANQNSRHQIDAGSVFFDAASVSQPLLATAHAPEARTGTRTSRELSYNVHVAAPPIERERRRIR